MVGRKRRKVSIWSLMDVSQNYQGLAKVNSREFEKILFFLALSS